MPIDPTEREKCRALVAGEADTILAIADGIATSIPPKRPLSEQERTMLDVPLKETIYKYGMNVDPAVSLAIAAGMIAFLRWQEWRHTIAARAADKLRESSIVPKVS